MINYDCLHDIENWGTIDAKKFFDSPKYNQASFSKEVSPKLQKLIETIKEQGNNAKHLIYTERNAKLVATSLMANAGYSSAYTVEAHTFVFSSSSSSFFGGGNSFAVCTREPVYGKRMGSIFYDKLVKRFNARPGNVSGADIRVMIADATTIDTLYLNDVTHVHIIEPFLTHVSREAVLRAVTPFCGHTGVPYDAENGWTVHVYTYRTVIPPSIQDYFDRDPDMLKHSTSLHDLYLYKAVSEQQKLVFVPELDRALIQASVDNALIGDLSRVHDDCKDIDPKKLPGVSKSQLFIAEYFSPAAPVKGMVLFHKKNDVTYMHNAMTAIATAMTSFEKQKYTILYVTNHEWKQKEWKRLYKHVATKIGVKEPVPTRWLDIANHTQFINAVKGKNALGKILTARNGEYDPLQNTLVIIEDVLGFLQYADKVAFYFQQSFDRSKTHSVRLMLMTPTLQETDMYDMIHAINLCLPKQAQLPLSYDVFAKEYLDANGRFTDASIATFKKKVSGIISYVDDTARVSTFAKPMYHDIDVPMSDYTFMDTLDRFVIAQGQLQDKETELKREQSTIDYDFQEFRENEQSVLLTPTDELRALEACKQAAAKARKNKETEFAAMYAERVRECEALPSDCIQAATQAYQEEDGKLRAKLAECDKQDKACKDAARREQLNARLKLKYDTDACKRTDAVVECKTKARTETKDAMDTFKASVKDACSKEHLDVVRKQQDIESTFNKRVNNFKEDRMKKLQDLERTVDGMKKQYDELKKTLVSNINSDNSQRKHMERCLQLQPAHARMISASKDTPHVIRNADADTIATNTMVYMVSGRIKTRPTAFNRRERVPAGSALVVFPACGSGQWMQRGGEFIQYFQDPANEKYLNDPVKYYTTITKSIGNTMRIYLPGDRMPSLYTTLFMNIEGKNNETAILKSGVIPITQLKPMDRQHFQVPPRHATLMTCKNFAGALKDTRLYDEEMHAEVFKDNVYTHASEYKPYDDLTQRSYKLLHVMNRISSGVYYCIAYGCQDHLPNRDRRPSVDKLIATLKERSARVNKESTTTLNVDELKRLKNIIQDVRAPRTIQLERIYEHLLSLHEIWNEDLDEATHEKCQNVFTEVDARLSRMYIHKEHTPDPPRISYKLRTKRVAYEGRKFIQFFIDKMVDGTIEKSSVSIGCIPEKLDVPALKCSAKTILIKLKHILSDKGFIDISMPKAPAAWTEANAMQEAQNICEQLVAS